MSPKDFSSFQDLLRFVEKNRKSRPQVDIEYKRQMRVLFYRHTVAQLPAKWPKKDLFSPPIQIRTDFDFFSYITLCLFLIIFSQLFIFKYAKIKLKSCVFFKFLFQSTKKLSKKKTKKTWIPRGPLWVRFSLGPQAFACFA